MNVDSTTPDWPVTRLRIYERFLGKLPRHKRELLDLVDYIHSKFPEWQWLQIARWMDGTQVPTDEQHAKLRNWELSQDEPVRSSSRIQLAPTDSSTGVH